MVAGVCALLKSINKNLTPAQIKNIIQTTADPITDAYLYPNSVGTGRLNAYKALIHAINNNCSSISVTGTQTTQKVYCKNITLENATIPSGITLELIATEQPRAAYCANAEGRVSYNSNFTVETGANFINY